MKKLSLAFGVVFVAFSVAFAGPEQYSGKEMKQVAPAPCPQWYADSEWNISLWGAYAFGGDSGKTVDEEDLDFVDGETVHFQNGVGDGAGGGGIDIKYFFHKYFGIGIEAYGLATDTNNDVNPEDLRDTGLDPHDNDGVGAVKGTLTLRFPIGCSRFAPYIFAGGGVLFGSEEETFVFVGSDRPNGSAVRVNKGTERINGSTKLDWERHHNDDARAIGQVGGGFEVRFTPHIGWMTDVAWNFTDDEDFGMVRGGINFAF